MGKLFFLRPDPLSRLEGKKKGARLPLVLGLVVGLAGLLIGLYAWFGSRAGSRSQLDFEAGRSDDLPLVILATERSAVEYSEALDLAAGRHSGAPVLTLDPRKPELVLFELKQLQPHYALIFICPEELDLNLAWRWLQLSTELDDDPFVDLRTGFITGETPAQAAAFMKRIIAVHQGSLKLPEGLIDNLAANTAVEKTAFQKSPGSFMIPVFAERLRVETISHGIQGFSVDRLNSMAGAGFLHFGGHGYPDRIVDSLNGVFVRKLELSPSVVFNGACFTGVTSRWFDQSAGMISEARVEAKHCFALGLLQQPVVGYLAALHADHGIPVYQEMEFLAYSGASLGEVIKHTYDGVVLGNGGVLPELPVMQNGLHHDWTPKQIMLRGTASRILFGDPSLTLLPAFTSRPFETTVVEQGNSTLSGRAILRNPKLKSTYTNTYAADLSGENQFNDRALMVFDLPPGWERIGAVKLRQVVAGARTLTGRLVGYAVEQDRGKHRLHVQVDLPSTGFLSGPFRQSGTAVELLFFQAEPE